MDARLTLLEPQQPLCAGYPQTPFFPLLEDDSVDLRIYDEDVTRNDLITRFSLGYDKLKAAGTLKRGGAESVVLSRLQER